MCLKHCGMKTEACNNNGIQKCYIIKHYRSQLNLTCSKPDHGVKHFLLCDHESCRKASEKYWAKVAERKKIFNFIPCEEIDMENEQIGDDYDDFDMKIAIGIFLICTSILYSNNGYKQ